MAVAFWILLACSPAGPAPATKRSPARTPSPSGAPSHAASATPSPAARPPACEQPCRRRPRIVGRFNQDAAPEASGIAAGRRNRDVLYVLDDGPGTMSLLAVDARTGRIIRRLQIDGLQGMDTESLAVGPCDAANCLYIGDIGDNATARDSITVTRVREPTLQEDPAASLPAERVTWRYPDAPADAEALLAAPDGTFAVVTKNARRSGRGAGRVYLADSFADTTLQRGPRVRLPPPERPFASVVLGNVVTGGEAGRGRVVLRTYDAIYEFTAPRPQAPLRAFPSWPVAEVASRAEPQGEAITYARDGCGLFTVSEGSGAVTSIPCR